ncbi:ATP-binding protein [Haladaptatus sp. DJG-WS-42]|uniref:ATP-binding protein n=1 Tax=Haladaptatus sp. DJG-WS-42 TaxID=3120516 RepID=UPI0030CF9542
MSATVSRRRWQPLLIIFLGCFFVALTLFSIFTSLGPTVSNFSSYVMPLLLSGGLIFFGGWLTQSDLESRYQTSIVLWCLGSMSLFGLLGLWAYYLVTTAGLDPNSAGFLLVASTSFGGFGGSIAGYYNVIGRVKRDEANLATRIIDSVMDGISLLDEDGNYIFVNPSYTDILGYDEAELISEHWTMLYDDETEQYIYDEVVPTLEQSGTWFGTVPAQRADGTEFPQEVALNRLSDGRHIAAIRDVSDHLRYEHSVEELHAVTREMMQAETIHEVCTLVVDASHNVLSMPLSAIWLYDAKTDRLEPEAKTDVSDIIIETLPSYSADDPSLSWDAFKRQELRIIEDLGTEQARANPNTKIRSEMIVPLGTFGVLNIGSMRTNAFDEIDERIARLLAANAEVALERADREHALTIKNDQLEFLNSLLRHDILNGMMVINSRADTLSTELSGDQQRHAETIVRWCTDITDLVTHVRGVLSVLTGDDLETSEDVNLSAVLEAELDRIRMTYPEVQFSVDIPADVTVEANHFLSEVFGNVLTNAIEHNYGENPFVEVFVAPNPADDEVTVHIGDNGPGVPDAHKESIFRRGVTGHAKTSGTGFGLFFIDTMVTQYGGSVVVKDREPTGALFCITLPLVATAER